MPTLIATLGSCHISIQQIVIMYGMHACGLCQRRTVLALKDLLRLACCILLPSIYTYGKYVHSLCVRLPHSAKLFLSHLVAALAGTVLELCWLNFFTTSPNHNSKSYLYSHNNSYLFLTGITKYNSTGNRANHTS